MIYSLEGCRERVMNARYPYQIKKARGKTYRAQFIDFEGVIAHGKTLEEAALNATDALNLALEELIDNGFDVPRPSLAKKTNKDIYFAEPDPDLQVVLLVYWARKENGVTLADLARSLNTSWASAQRLEKPGNNPTLKNLNDVAAGLGKRLVLTFE